MRTELLVCPNCAGQMETHRKEKQPTRHHVVHLHWVICLTCRHVALHSWTIRDLANTATGARDQ